jgi:hypothetical protein
MPLDTTLDNNLFSKKSVQHMFSLIGSACPWEKSRTLFSKKSIAIAARFFCI